MSEENVDVVQQAMAQLHEDGLCATFAHWRWTGNGDGLQRYSQKYKWLDLFGQPRYSYPAPAVELNGGKTLCSILPLSYRQNYNDDYIEPIALGWAHCSNSEPFCYAQGRRIALVRAIEELIEDHLVDSDTYHVVRGGLWREIHRYFQKTCRD